MNHSHIVIFIIYLRIAHVYGHENNFTDTVVGFVKGLLERIRNMIRHIRFTLLLLLTGVSYLSAQQVETASYDSKASEDIKLACVDQFAGNVSLGEVVAQSEAIALGGPMFLCYQDRFTILNSNADLTGDPIPGTLPGIGYAFYSCDPGPGGITGTTLGDIEADPCALNTPPADPGNDPDIPDFWVYTDEIDGTALFQNSNQLGGQTVPEFFNGGDPVQIHFAPMTFDHFYSNEQEPGNCLNVNVDEAFPVVYLNEISISNCIVEENGGVFTGTFTVEGGYSEYNGSDYPTVAVVRSGNFNNQAELIGGPFMHGDQVTFTTDIPGDYTILIQDDISCGAEKDITVQANLETLNIEAIPQTPGPYSQGDFICVDYVVTGFDSISFTSWTMNFDPEVLSFFNVITPPIPSLGDNNFVETLIDEGLLLFSWFQQDATGFTLPDGSIFFEVCFTVIGEPGECSPLFIDDSPTQISISGPGPDGFGEQYDFNYIDTELCVEEGPLPTVYASSCSANGTNAGSITFYVAGGQAPYSYVSDCFAPGNIQNSLQEVTIPDLIAGSCTITITDAGMNTTEIIVDITNDPPLDFEADVTDPLCYGFPNGKIKITNIFGGVEDYEITWSDGTQIADSIKNLAEGIYTVTVEDSRGCEVEKSFAVGVDPLEIEFNIIDTTTCEQVQDGIIQAIGSGGTPINTNRYNYQWNNPNLNDMGVITSTNSEIPVGPGLVIIRDANNCNVTVAYDMLFKKEVTAIIDLPEIQCNGEEVVITTTAGTTNNSCSNFSFNWSSGVVSASTGNIDTTLPQGEGDYTLIITDCDGCQLDTMFTLDEPNPIMSPTLVDFECGDATGSISVFPGGGTSPFDFEWSDDPTINTSIRTDLLPGTYVYTITDDNGCMRIDSATIEQGAGLVPDTFFVTPIECAGEMNGAITVDVLGQGDFSYNWEGPDGAIDDMDQTITGLGAGTYIVTVSDDTGCEAIDSVEIIAPDTIMIMPNFFLPSCNGEADGTISLVVTGGEPNYIYSWEEAPSNVTEILPAISAGTYTVTVFDSEGCSSTEVMVLEDQVTIDIDINIIDEIACAGDSLAVVEVTMTGGPSDNGFYGTVFSNGEGNSLQDAALDTAFTLPAGTNSVIVFDAFCSDTLEFEITEPQPIAINLAQTVVTDASCFGNCDGEVMLTADGGTGDFDYLWQSSGNMTEIESDLCAGWQVVEIRDENMCLKLDSVFIDQPDSLVLMVDLLGTINPSCNEDSEGQITVDYAGGNIGPVTYTWTDNVSDDASASMLSNGTYGITVTDALGCTDTTSHLLFSPPPVFGLVPTPDEPVCFGDQTCITVTDLVGGSGEGYRFQINNSSLFPADSCVSVFAGEYTVNMVDSDGCAYDTTIVINQPSESLAAITINSDTNDNTVSLGDSLVFLEVQLNQTFNIDTIMWFGDFDFNCVDPECTRIQIFPQGDATFSVMAVDIDGCIATDDIIVRIDDERKVYFPNTFTPNSDGFNDRFQLFTGFGVEEILVIQVYDRWGNKMYEETNLEPNPGGVGEGWDGSFNGQVLDPGVYVYRAEISFIDGRTIPYSGSITLLK